MGLVFGAFLVWREFAVVVVALQPCWKDQDSARTGRLLCLDGGISPPLHCCRTEEGKGGWEPQVILPDKSSRPKNLPLEEITCLVQDAIIALCMAYTPKLAFLVKLQTHQFVLNVPTGWAKWPIQTSVVFTPSVHIFSKLQSLVDRP